MKILVFFFAFMILSLKSAFCIGVLENPVNVKEIDLGQIEDITISYKSDDVLLFKNNSDLLIIKEYMSKNDKDYYARISNSGNRLVVEAGKRPILFGSFITRIEIYIPVSNKNITIKTSSGAIKGNDEYTASTIKMESSSGDISLNSVIAKMIDLKTTSGSIRCKKIIGNTNVHTNSGKIVLGSINGNVSAEASSGEIEMKSLNGTVDARTSSGNINCTVAENAGDISITTTSGNIVLNIPRNYALKFSLRTSSGSLRTPFDDKLFNPVSDKNHIQGVIGQEGENIKNVNIKTTSGSTRINLVN